MNLVTVKILDPFVDTDAVYGYGETHTFDYEYAKPLVERGVVSLVETRKVPKKSIDRLKKWE